ncbi:TPA: phage terminase large subunit [Clostridioides difficile]|nr:phage terminase large subunit [Clostridioides difficile]
MVYHNNIPDDVLSQLEEYERYILIIQKEFNEAMTSGDYETAEYHKDNAEHIKKEYRKLRSEYDVLYFAYEYFSDTKNPENENNLIPLGVTYETAPDFHIELCSKLDELEDTPTKKIAWSCPRGHGKSAYLSNIFPVHQVIFKKRHYILIVSETERMSQRFVEWVADQLKFNEKLRADFGEVLSPNKMSNESDNIEGFITHTSIKVQSASMGKQLRGARNGAYRPDLVILDDLESAKNTNTKELRDKNLHWFNSVIVPIGDITRTSYIYMGTLVHSSGLLPEVLKRSDYDGKIYSAIVSEPDHPEMWEHLENMLKDVDNPNRLDEAKDYYNQNREMMDSGVKTLWSERFTYFELMAIKVNVGSRAFASEYLNKPSDDETCIFKPDYFMYYDDKDLWEGNRKIHLDVYGFWDIAIGKNSRSDYNAITIIGRDNRTGVIYVLDTFAEKIPMHKALQVAMEMIIKWRPRVFGVETVQAQYDMYRQLREMLMKNGIYNTRLLAFNPKGKKEDRIEQLEPLVEGGYLRFKKSQRLLLEQLNMFPNADYDDLPDALASSVEISGKQRKRSFYKKPKGF